MLDVPSAVVQNAWKVSPHPTQVSVWELTASNLTDATVLSLEALPLCDVADFAKQPDVMQAGCFFEQSKIQNSDPDRALVEVILGRTGAAPTFQRPKVGVKLDVVVHLVRTSDTAG